MTADWNPGRDRIWLSFFSVCTLPGCLLLLMLACDSGGGDPRSGRPEGQTGELSSPTDSGLATGSNPSDFAVLKRVADGDTLEAIWKGKKIRVRMHGVDAPELNQPFGPESRQCLENLLSSQRFSLQIEYRDPYGRSVATLLDAKGKDLNAELVERGCAWAFRRYSKKYVPREKVARDSKAGLWGVANPVPPWEWRKR